MFYRLFTLFISKSIFLFLCVLRLTLALLLALHLSWLIICWHPLAANETAKLSRRASGCCVILSVLCSGSSTVCSECVCVITDIIYSPPSSPCRGVCAERFPFLFPHTRRAVATKPVCKFKEYVVWVMSHIMSSRQASSSAAKHDGTTGLWRWLKSRRSEFKCEKMRLCAGLGAQWWRVCLALSSRWHML